MKAPHHTPVRLVLPVLLLAAATAASAQQAATPAEGREHVVRRGDTLWDLARAYLQNPFLWPVIYEANRNVVEDPHWIFPSERLVIPPVPARPAPLPAGQPVAQPAAAVTTDAAPGLTRISLSLDAPPPEPADTPATLLLSPEQPRPAVTRHEYLSAPWLSADPAAGTRGRITAKTDPAAASERMVPTLYPQQLVNVAVSGTAPAPGDSLLMVRPGRRVGNTGNIVYPMGILRVEQVSGGVAVARVVAQFGDARVGDLVASMPVVPELPVGSPEPVQTAVAGQLLQFVQREGLHSPADLAFLSIGQGQGLGIGDELSVYVPAGSGTPAVPLAVVRVVRADQVTSTVRVVSVSSTALRAGLPVSLIRKMP